MRRVSVFPYWRFGTSFRFLQDAKAGWKIHGSNFVVENIELVLKNLAELGLRVTDRLAQPLRDRLEELRAAEETARLTEAQAAALSKSVQDIRPTVSAELKGIEAFVLNPKRIPVDTLLGDVSQQFAPGVVADLGSTARYDIEEAAKCIACERSTGAAFHLLRAVEGVLKRTYFHFVKKNREQTPMWANMIASLRKSRKASKHVTLLDHLDHLRTNFRNPTQHPEAIYNIEEAQDLWALCVDALNRMHKVLSDGKVET